MSLSAKERILKLRETEFKLQKLQTDLQSNNESENSIMSEFLSHHKELMALPGSTKNSLPFRFDFEAPNRYIELKQTQKLTLPPKVPAKSARRLQAYKESYGIYDLAKNESSMKSGLAGHRSLALQSILNDLDKQTTKKAISIPKVDKFSLQKKTPFLKRFPKSSVSKTTASSASPLTKGFFNNNNIITTANTNSKNIKMMWNYEQSETGSTSTTSELLLSNDSQADTENKINQDVLLEDFSPKSMESIAYSLGTSNIMGVILPSSSNHATRGPSSWDGKFLSSSSSIAIRPTSEIGASGNVNAKEAVAILRRRRLQQRKLPLPNTLPPHQRGLIGVEISNFEPQCAFFYRDRNGNYNPHLHHSINVTENMKNEKRWSKYVKSSSYRE